MRQANILIMMLCLQAVIFSSTCFSQQKKKFKIYNALLYKSVPDLTKYGFDNFHIIYEDGVVSTNYRVKAYKALNRRYIDTLKIKSNAILSRDIVTPICLDVECWSLYKKSSKKIAEENYISLIKRYREVDTINLVSVFHYGAISEKINKVSNVVYPAFYTDSLNFDSWKQKVNYFIKKLEKMNNKNPIYAFIWPQYNLESKKNKKRGFVDSVMWRKELEYLYNLCDGIVIWSHYADENGNDVIFHKDMNWFRETLSFIKEKKLIRK